MKLLSFLLLSIFLIIQPNYIVAQSPSQIKRTIYWVHGLAGDPSDTWTRAKNYSNTNYDTKSMQVDYGSDPDNLHQAAGSMSNYIIEHLNEIEGNDPPFIIAHSQGGLVSRMLEYRDEDEDNTFYYGGIVTFGTAHKGAEIIDNIDHVYSLASEACDIYSERFILEHFTGSFFFTLPLLKQFTTQALETLQNSLCDDLAPVALEALFSDFLADIISDYAPGDGENNLNTKLLDYEGAPGVIGVAYYGEEEPIITYRFLYYLLNSPEGPLFGDADDDSGIEDEYEAYIAERRAEIETNQLLYDINWGLSRTYDFPFIWFANEHRNEAKEIEKLIESLNREIEFLEDLDNQWQWAIGAKSYIHTPKYYCECETSMGSPPLQLVDFQVYEVDDPSECDPECRLYTTREASEYVQLESNDGIITSTSAEGAPWADYDYDMEGSSHFQMRNDSRLAKRLKDLYDGKVDPFFQID